MALGGRAVALQATRKVPAVQPVWATPAVAASGAPLAPVSKIRRLRHECSLSGALSPGLIRCLAGWTAVGGRSRRLRRGRAERSPRLVRVVGAPVIMPRAVRPLGRV